MRAFKKLFCQQHYVFFLPARALPIQQMAAGRFPSSVLCASVFSSEKLKLLLSESA